MGCGLRKLEDPDDSSPGKIFSTLKRPQVETKTDSAYEYVLLDFTLEGIYFCFIFMFLRKQGIGFNLVLSCLTYSKSQILLSKLAKTSDSYFETQSVMKVLTYIKLQWKLLKYF